MRPVLNKFLHYRSGSYLVVELGQEAVGVSSQSGANASTPVPLTGTLSRSLSLGRTPSSYDAIPRFNARLSFLPIEIRAVVHNSPVCITQPYPLPRSAELTRGNLY